MFPAEHLNPKAPTFMPSQSHHHAPAQSQIPCRFGTACTRPGCSFLHPARQSATACRFGAACTKATCQFQHPEGRGALPSSFHRGLGTTGGLANATDSNTSHNKSVTFNNGKPMSAAELEKQVKEVEEKKKQAKAAVAQAQAAAAASKGDNAKSVSVAV
jgi:nuclear polyadenylated RNA-binding protein NAB2